jgi:hypothetical protein
LNIRCRGLRGGVGGRRQQGGVDDLKRAKDAGAGTIVHRFQKDAVAVVFVARLVTMDLASGRFTNGRKAMMRAVVVWLSGGKC